MLQMVGPTGIGFLYGKIELLSEMPPFLGTLHSLGFGSYLYFLSSWISCKLLIFASSAL